MIDEDLRRKFLEPHRVTGYKRWLWIYCCSGRCHKVLLKKIKKSHSKCIECKSISAQHSIFSFLRVHLQNCTRWHSGPRCNYRPKHYSVFALEWYAKSGLFYKIQVCLTSESDFWHFYCKTSDKEKYQVKSDSLI